ncbi:MAG: hypothetical protein PHE50_10195 [Dehalococcoidales bacterium]|nr:hypothetical protein [Dehalococcoidales bacterium]
MKVAELTVDQFRKLVGEIVEQKLEEKLGSSAGTAGMPGKTMKASAVTLEQVCRQFGMIMKE